MEDTIAVTQQHPDTVKFTKCSSDDSQPLRGLTTSMIKLVVSVTLLAVVAALLITNYSVSEIISDVRQFSPEAICSVFAALLANTLAATFRFKAIATGIGYPLGFRSALATVSTSNLVGALFFQIAGQLLTRGVIAGRGGIPFAEVVVITTYERIPAALVSALFALGGAFFIFGNIYLDRSSSGEELIKLISGLTAATTVGALIGYGRIALRSIRPLVGRHFARQCLTIIGLALLVQAPMQAAYLVAAHTLSPQTPIASLAAASAIVMFASSVPISFAGWGIREMSAIAALGAIGVPAHASLTTAAFIGVGSLLVVGLFAIISLPNFAAVKGRASSESTTRIDYRRTLTWVLPISSATLVLFQIYIPIGSGVLNVNLADPIVLIGGVLFALNALKHGRAPKWRAPYVNIAALFATVFLTISLILGAWRYGLTSWAWVNRYLGWFGLLCYAATGALAVRENGKEALRIALLTFVGAASAVAGIDVVLVLLREAGTPVSSSLILPGSIDGFSQNRNSFAFQLLLATCATMIFACGASLRSALLALFFAALWFSGSRSGWITCTSIIGIGLYLGATTKREIVIAGSFAVALAVIAIASHFLSTSFGAGIPAIIPEARIPAIIPSESSTQERLVSILGGLKLFEGHPIFGAGLGAFYSQLIPTLSGSPLVIHSTAVWMLAELGFAGFLIFAAPAVRIFVTEWRSAKHDVVSALIVLCLAAFVVMSTPADMLYQRAFWLFMGAALAFAPTISDRLSSEHDSSALS